MARPRQVLPEEAEAWFASAASMNHEILSVVRIKRKLLRRYPVRMALTQAMFTWMARRAHKINGMSREEARWLL